MSLHIKLSTRDLNRNEGFEEEILMHVLVNGLMCEDNRQSQARLISILTWKNKLDNLK